MKLLAQSDLIDTTLASTLDIESIGLLALMTLCCATMHNSESKFFGYSLSDLPLFRFLTPLFVCLSSHMMHGECTQRCAQSGKQKLVRENAQVSAIAGNYTQPQTETFVQIRFKRKETHRMQPSHRSAVQPPQSWLSM